FQTAPGCNGSTITVRRELHEMGFHGRAAAHKPNITMHNAKRRLEWFKACRHWTLEQWKQLLGKINIMVNGGSCYTNNMFHKVQAALREEQMRILKERKEKIKREKELRQKQEAEILRDAEKEKKIKLEEEFKEQMFDEENKEKEEKEQVLPVK
uniref:Transposase Tc1-like domain-containing protein n=1 Tax=Salmo trutta TaxID=8032 RepID=A0A674C3B3_SALTR